MHWVMGWEGPGNRSRSLDVLCCCEPDGPSSSAVSGSFLECGLGMPPHQDINQPCPHPALPAATNRRDDTGWEALGLAVCVEQHQAFLKLPCWGPCLWHSLALLGCLFSLYRSAFIIPHLPPQDIPQPSSAWPAPSNVSQPTTCE